MSSKLPLPLKVPPDVWKWIRTEAAHRRLPVGNYVLELLRRGIQDETVDQTIVRVRSGITPAGTKELLRQVLMIRYIQEATIGATTYAMLAADAAHRADVELEKIFRDPDRPA